MTDGRKLSDADVRAIANELKAGLLKDFQMEVGKGVIFWAKRVTVLLLIILALYGVLGGDKSLLAQLSGKGG